MTPRWLPRFLAVIPMLALSVSALAAPADDLTVDLHAHLFMNTGMTWMFRGAFEGPLRARSWSSRFSSQANPESVEKSRIGVLVVSLYAHPLMTWSRRRSIRTQIREAERFVAEHPGLIIARDPEQARQALDQGKRVMVLSLEGAAGILETEADFREFIDEKGIRIVTLLHLTDDYLGGAAFMRSFHAIGNPWRWFLALFRPRYDDTGAKMNARGLTADGRRVARALIDRGVWIDLSHSSDAAQRELIPMLERAGQPLLYTHGGLRRFTGSERGLSDDQLAEIRRSGGIVGICPSEDVVGHTPVPAGSCGGPGCPVACDHGLPGFIEHYKGAVEALGSGNVLVGSDFNGALPHLRPSCGTGTSLDRGGLWNIGQMGEFWEAMRRSHAPVPARLSAQIDSFLSKWGRVTR